MFCPNCGAQTVEGAAFCVKCGKPLPNLSGNQTVNAVPQAQNTFTQPSVPIAGGTVQINQHIAQPVPQANTLFTAPQQVPAQAARVGFTNAVNDPRYASKKRSQGCAAFIFSLIIIPMPFIGFVAYSYFWHEMAMTEALKIGGGVSGIFLLFYLFLGLKKMFSSQWDGVVIALTEEEHLYHRHSSTNRSFIHNNDYYYLYVVKIQTDDGRIKRIESKSENSYYYNYLEVGDRVRYHPDIDYYEKYDKSNDTHILCPFCNKVNPISEDVCKCGAPVLK